MATELLENWMERMEGKVDGLRGDIAELKSVRDQVEKHEERIYGNGQPGLIKDVDRLKQARNNQRWLIAAVLVPGLVALVDLIVRLVSK